MNDITEITALIDKQLEGVKIRLADKLARPMDVPWKPYYDCIDDLVAVLKIITQLQRLGKWVQHGIECQTRWPVELSNEKRPCTCGLSAEQEAIKRELEG